MKTIAVIFLFLYSINSVAQPGADSAGTNSSITFIKDSIEIPVDTVDPRPRNIYGDLMNDDPRYNRRYSVGLVLARVTSSNVFGWAYSRYVMKEEMG